jgi:phenylacetate-CoA ligase
MGKLYGEGRMIEFKVKDFFYPVDLLKAYFLLRRSEHWSAEQMRSYQARKLAQLLCHCAVEVPYYRDLFPQLGLRVDLITPSNAFECLAKVPVLDKDTLREAPERFLAGNASRFHPKAITTSGTTGTPLTVYWDRGSNVMEFSCIQRLWRWAGIRIGHAFLDLRSCVFPTNHKNLKTKGSAVFLRNWKVNGLEFNADYIDKENIEDYYQVLLRYRPRLVRGHPQAIQYLANLLRERGLDGWRPTAVTTASETLYEFQRQDIEAAWGTPIMDSYGLKEHNVFIAQCREGSYHLSPEYGVCEIVDDTSQDVSAGGEGWVVATGLHNYAQPLLRYQTRDRAIVGHNKPCACGRTLPYVERIVGRIDDCLCTRDGRRFSGMHFAFFGRRGVKKARLIQEDLETVKVELLVDSQFDQSERDAVLDALARKVGGRLTFRLCFPDEIRQKTPGKFKFVVSHLPQTGSFVAAH